MIRILPVAVTALVIFPCSLAAVSQATPSALPQDPMALMTLAHEKDGLGGADMKPWHVHGVYHSYKDGKLDYEGTYEEWWFSPSKYKVSFTNPKQVQTDYATGTALLRNGTEMWLKGPELVLQQSVLEPAIDPSLLKEFKLVRKQKKVGKIKLQCVSFTHRLRDDLQVNSDFFATACFDPSSPVLRVFGHNRLDAVYDDTALFQGHYVAKKITMTFNDKPLADLQLDTVEMLNEPAEGVLAAPSRALRVDLSGIQFSPSPFQLFWTIKQTIPEYPQEAKDRRVQGTVDIEVTIGEDGHVEGATAVGGPMELRGAALDAVRQWVYRPFDVMGQPRSFKMLIHETFSISG